jgi:hypothetical protein
VSRGDRAIGIILGLALGIAIVAIFVFVFSEETIDSAGLEGGSGTQTEQTGGGAP